MRLRSFDDGHAARPLNTLLQNRKPSSEVHGTFWVKSVDVAVGLSLRNCYKNIVTLSRAIHHFLSGDETELMRYKHLSTSPFSAEAEKIKSEKLSKEELHRWLYPSQVTSNNAYSDD